MAYVDIHLGVTISAAFLASQVSARTMAAPYSTVAVMVKLLDRLKNAP